MEKNSTLTNLNILIVEDVYDDMEVAKKFVKRNFENVIVFGVTTAHDAGEILQDNDIDLLLLDIRLPDGTGFELATKLRETPKYRFLHIIFITGYEYNKVGVYEKYHCYSYIEKPYTEERLIGQLRPLIKGIREEKQEGRRRVRQEVKYFSTEEGSRLIPVEDILYAEVALRRLTIHTVKGDYVVPGMSMKKFVKYMNSSAFIKCHESFVFNIKNAVGIKNGAGRYHTVDFGTEDDGCVISQRCYVGVRELLANYASKEP